MTADIVIVAIIAGALLALDISLAVTAARADEREAERRDYETKKEVTA